MRMKMSRLLYLVCMIILVLTGCVYTEEEQDYSIENGTKSTEENHSGDTREESSKEDDNSGDGTSQLTETEAIEIEEAFFDILFSQETKEGSNEIIHYESKESLINVASEVVKRELASYYVDQYYREEEGKLYIIPMDGVTQLQLDSQYDFIHKEDNVYALIQDEENLMIGDYELVITFEKIDGQWKMSDREMKVE